jgi:hypothetical protein
LASCSATVRSPLRDHASGAKMFVKRLVKDEQGYFGLSSVSDVQKMEILSRMTKSHKEGEMELTDELRNCATGLYV